MKIAIVHYWFITKRGGEKVIESILKLFPEADIYTLFYDKEKYDNSLSNQKIYTSVLNNSFLRKHHQKVFPLYPIGIKSLKLKDKYDLIISSESGPAKGIINKEKTPHICYIHTPMRYCWSHKETYLSSLNFFLRPVVNFFLNRLQSWDKKTIENVDLYISNSKNVAKRVKKYYNRDSKIIHPPIEERFYKKEIPILDKEHYLSFGALVPYKRIDLLVEVFNLNKKKLVIIGEGPEMKKLKRKANSNIKFIGRLKDDKKLMDFFLKARALIFPGEEDFGMVPIEVMASGVPVIAFGKGGALETVIENRDNISESTGLFFNTQEREVLNNTITYFEKVEKEFDKDYIIKHAKNFTEKKFISEFSRVINNFIKTKNVDL